MSRQPGSDISEAARRAFAKLRGRVADLAMVLAVLLAAALIFLEAWVPFVRKIFESPLDAGAGILAFVVVPGVYARRKRDDRDVLIALGVTFVLAPLWYRSANRIIFNVLVDLEKIFDFVPGWAVEPMWLIPGEWVVVRIGLLTTAIEAAAMAAAVIVPAHIWGRAREGWRRGAIRAPDLRWLWKMVFVKPAPVVVPLLLITLTWPLAPFILILTKIYTPKPPAVAAQTFHSISWLLVLAYFFAVLYVAAWWARYCTSRERRLRRGTGRGGGTTTAPAWVRREPTMSAEEKLEHNLQQGLSTFQHQFPDLPPIPAQPIEYEGWFQDVGKRIQVRSQRRTIVEHVRMLEQLNTLQKQ